MTEEEYCRDLMRLGAAWGWAWVVVRMCPEWKSVKWLMEPPVDTIEERFRAIVKQQNIPDPLTHDFGLPPYQHRRLVFWLGAAAGQDAALDAMGITTTARTA